MPVVDRAHRHVFNLRMGADLDDGARVSPRFQGLPNFAPYVGTNVHGLGGACRARTDAELHPLAVRVESDWGVVVRVEQEEEKRSQLGGRYVLDGIP